MKVLTVNNSVPPASLNRVLHRMVRQADRLQPAEVMGGGGLSLHVEVSAAVQNINPFAGRRKIDRDRYILAPLTLLRKAYSALFPQFPQIKMRTHTGNQLRPLLMYETFISIRHKAPNDLVVLRHIVKSAYQHLSSGFTHPPDIPPNIIGADGVIPVYKGQIFSDGGINPGVSCGAHAGIFLREKQDPVIFSRKPFHDLSASVSAAIINDDDLKITVGLAHHRPKASLYIILQIINRDDNGNGFIIMRSSHRLSPVSVFGIVSSWGPPSCDERALRTSVPDAWVRSASSAERVVTFSSSMETTMDSVNTFSISRKITTRKIRFAGDIRPSVPVAQ